MTYENEIANEQITRPKGSLELFEKEVSNAIAAFEENEMVLRLRKKELQLQDYHQLLLNLFHQTFIGPSTFAVASGYCEPHQSLVREYLIHHAEEEKLHWTWVINDLRSSGYKGPDPREGYPSPECQAYVAYAFWLANKNPVGRLAMAAVLEGISSRYGQELGTALCTDLKLTKDNVKFFIGHGELDEGHSDDVMEIIVSSRPSTEDWASLIHVASCTSSLYSNLYNGAARASVHRRSA